MLLLGTFGLNDLGGCVGVIPFWGYRDNGKEHGNYYNRVIQGLGVMVKHGNYYSILGLYRDSEKLGKLLEYSGVYIGFI